MRWPVRGSPSYVESKKGCRARGLKGWTPGTASGWLLELEGSGEGSYLDDLAAIELAEGNTGQARILYKRAVNLEWKLGRGNPYRSGRLAVATAHNRMTVRARRIIQPQGRRAGIGRTVDRQQIHETHNRLFLRAPLLPEARP